MLRDQSKNSVAMTWLMDDQISTQAGISLARMVVPAGVLSECHQHPNCAETIHLQSGTVRQRIGENWLDLSAGDTCVVPIGQPHQTENIGAEDAVMIICYSAGTRVYERVS